MLSIDSFLQALYDQQIKLHVRLTKPKSLKDATATAESVEAAIRQAKGSKQSHFVNSVSSNDQEDKTHNKKSNEFKKQKMPEAQTLKQQQVTHNIEEPNYKRYWRNQNTYKNNWQSQNLEKPQYEINCNDKFKRGRIFSNRRYNSQEYENQGNGRTLGIQGRFQLYN